MRCQKSKFILSNKAIYLNCAYMSPMLKKVENAGIKGLKQKRKPYKIYPKDFFNNVVLTKKAFASLVGCDNYQRIAIIPSASYGIGNVVNNISLKPNEEVLVLGEQFPSNIYPWSALCKKTRGKLVVVNRSDSLINSGEKWNEKILDSITKKTKVVAISNIHWVCGTLFNLMAIRKKTKKVGALLIIDGTQSVGALPFDIKKINPDALICAGYKWLMGPYGVGLAYYGEVFDKGIPIEDNWINRKNSKNFSELVNYNDNYGDFSARYNVGQQSNFILIPMLLAGLQQIKHWGIENIQNYCSDLISEEIKKIDNNKYWVENEKYRANHLFGIKQLIPNKSLLKLFKNKKISVSLRGDKIRVSPHVYNVGGEIKKLFQCFV